MADDTKSALAGVIGGGKGGAKAPAKKAAAKKDTTKKAAAPKKAASGIVRAKSTVSKEGTQKCAFSGEVLPVTAFPTSKDKDGNVVRGKVARKHLEASRAANKKDREAKKAAEAKAKADAKSKANTEK